LTDHEENKEKAEKIFLRELGRLELSLKCLNQDADYRIALCHYPPIGADLTDSRASVLLEQYNVNVCVFGHLHNLKPGTHIFGEKNGIQYFLTACDYLNFTPQRVL